ncbi:MAG: winged helix DNA-binding protein [Nanoarchaeota archaeon]|nr:winged helix DNA-binding protein [Nanoarchaeota archaeon]
MDVELLNWVKDGKYRIKTLELLNSQPLLSSELANKLDINRASMSRILRGLKEKGLVSPISNNTRTVTYVLTKKGKELLKIVSGNKNGRKDFN